MATSDFSSGKFLGARFSNVFVADCNFIGANFTVSVLNRNQLEGLVSKGVRWKEVDLQLIQKNGALLEGISLRDVDLSGAIIYIRWRRRKEFTAAQYSGKIVWIKEK